MTTSSSTSRCITEVGRNPEAKAADERDAQLVAVDDPTSAVSGRRRFVLGDSVVVFGERTARIIAVVAAKQQGSSPPS